MSYSKLHNHQVFEAEVNGEVVTFTCYSQGTSYGFRHIVTRGFNYTDDVKWLKGCIVAKACYYNRTWERWMFESVLKVAIAKLDANIRQEVYDQIINRMPPRKAEAVA